MEIELEELPDQPVVGMRFRSSIEKIAEDIGNGYAKVFGILGQKQVSPAGPPFALYFDLEMNEQDFDMETCVPVDSEVEVEGEVIYHVLPGGKHTTTMHMGPYDQMVPTYQAMLEWMGEKGLKPLAPVREVYLNDPSQVADPKEIMTKIIWPVE